MDDDQKYYVDKSGHGTAFDKKDEEEGDELKVENSFMEFIGRLSNFIL